LSHLANIANRDTCEGSRCTEARESYLEVNMITEEDYGCFGDVKHGGVIYIIDCDALLKVEVDSVISSKTGIELCYGEQSVIVEETTQESSYGDTFIFLKKDEALKKFESVMSEKIVKMAKYIAMFTD